MIPSLLTLALLIYLVSILKIRTDANICSFRVYLKTIMIKKNMLQNSLILHNHCRYIQNLKNRKGMNLKLTHPPSSILSKIEINQLFSISALKSFLRIFPVAVIGNDSLK